MNPELIAAAVLMGPGLLLAPVCIAGHLRQARRDNAAAAACAAFRPPQPADPQPPHDGGEPAPAPELPDNVIGFPAHRHRTTAPGERNAA
ncbi:hypothetical protein QZH56_22830 [Streptomyces olivoreticuli]|uniref:hypothetical protein n=1 Tax=Streptomyces olivoreticuli TaxID=68246 RepID=UPI00265B221B|nr:hypothetical protein [Streptomyces olivoreticuli]WKK21676.1 hypothetical protein QZH56_22830 [Streptomyces olivoreticuli]